MKSKLGLTLFGSLFVSGLASIPAYAGLEFGYINETAIEIEGECAYVYKIGKDENGEIKALNWQQFIEFGPGTSTPWWQGIKDLESADPDPTEAKAWSDAYVKAFPIQQGTHFAFGQVGNYPSGGASVDNADGSAGWFVSGGESEIELMGEKGQVVKREFIYNNGGSKWTRFHFWAAGETVPCEEMIVDNPQVPNIDLDESGSPNVYTSQQLAEAKVEPVFEGGTLQFSQGYTETAKDFRLEDFESNQIQNSGLDVELSGVLSGLGGMIYTGSGVTTLSGTAAYTGDTVVKEGTLSLKASSETFDVASSAVDVEGGATLRLEAPSKDSAAFSVNSLSLRQGSTLDKQGGWASLSVEEKGLFTQGDVTIAVAVPDGKDPQIENGLHLNASAWSGDGTISKEGRGVLTIGCERRDESECSVIGFPGETSYGYSGTINVQQGFLSLYRASLPKASIDVSSESVLEVGLVKSRSFQDEGESGTIKIGALSGEGRVIIDTNSLETDTVELQVGSADVDSTFSGVISGLAAHGGSADFAKVGSGTLTLAGANAYEGKTTIRDGVLALANASGIPQASSTLVNGSGRLDLATNLIGRGEFRIDQLTVADGGQLFVRASQPLVSKNIVLNANAAGSSNPGGIAVALKSKNEPPIRVTEAFDYQNGSLAVFAPESDSPEGTWKIIDGDVDNVVELSKNTYLKVVGSVGDLNFGGDRYEFEGIGRDHLVFGKKMVNYQGFLKDGSLNLVIEKRDIDLDDPKNPPDCEGLLCDSLPDSEIGDEIISEILNPGFIDGDLDLPIMGWNDIANLVFSGLSPRNVDGPGRGLATYSNLLSDTVFERLPLRQFTPVEVQEAVVEQEQVIEAVPEQLPVRGLWSKSGEVSDVVAQQALDQAIAQAAGADADQPLVLASETVAFEQDGVSYVENPSLTAQYAERDGVRGWFRAFGGNSGASRSDVFYNDYAVNAGGGVVGVDVSVAPQVQIGAFANYGTINLWQNDSGTGGGSWSPDGWGGGITADYWTNNFYVQGLFAATGFNGSQRRGTVEITDQLGGESASGDKSATNYTYAVRMGAPFETGRWLLEPQFTATWSQNEEHGFSESGAGDLNLRYRDRSTLYLQTELGMKFTLPINSGDRGLWVPSLKLAWLGDWNQNNADQTIGYAFTNKTLGVPSNQEDVNGALVEVGLDYTIANLNSTSWKLYVKGGAEIWGGDRGTDWRGSGGVTFQF